MLAYGRFLREHQDVCAVEYCVRDVGHLGPRRARVVHHGLEHLRCCYDRDGERVARRDYLLLNKRDLLDWILNAQVSARHHDNIGGADDSLQVIESFALLNLCYYRWRLDLLWQVLRHKSSDAFDIRGVPYKRSRNIVHVVAKSKQRVLLVFIRERWKVLVKRGDIYPLSGEDLSSG